MLSQIEKYTKPAHSNDSPSTGAARLDTKPVTPPIAQLRHKLAKRDLIVA